MNRSQPLAITARRAAFGGGTLHTAHDPRKSVSPILALCAAAFLLATPAAAQPAFIRKFAEEILRSVSSEERPKLAEFLSHGRLTEASSRLGQIAIQEGDTQTSVRLRNLAEMLKAEDPARWRDADSAGLSTVRLGQGPQLSSDDLALFRAVEAGSRRLLWFTVVPLRVQQFLYRYSLGYRNPEVMLASADSRMQRQIQRARSFPRERVVTIISSGKDRGLVLRRTEQLESEGYAVLSYLFCETPTGQFCRDEMIGAFAAISGQVMELNTANARTSSFVFEEKDAVSRLIAGQELVTVISYDDLAAAAKQSAESLATAAARRYLVESLNN